MSCVRILGADISYSNYGAGYVCAVWVHYKALAGLCMCVCVVVCVCCGGPLYGADRPVCVCVCVCMCVLWGSIIRCWQASVCFIQI